MIIIKGIKGILFDSGRVLNAPATGHWFITEFLLKKVGISNFYSLPRKQVELALNKANDYLHKNNLILNEEEEYKHFIQYYKLFFKNFPHLRLKDKDIEAIAKDYVYNYKKYNFFEDVQEIIPKLAEKYKLALVADAWPSLESVYEKSNLKKYFSTFVISSQLGVSKLDDLMYKKAIEELGIEVQEALLIDDNIENCKVAAALGINVIVLCRDDEQYEATKNMNTDFIIVRELKEVIEYIK